MYDINNDEELDQLVESLMSNITDYFKHFFKKFKYLSDSEFKLLLDVIYGWYYLNYKFTNDIRTNEVDVYNLFEKIKSNNNTELPKKLYRGLSFETINKRDEFIDSIQRNGKITGKVFRLNKDIIYTSWTSNKGLLKKFLPKGEHIPETDKFGLILTLDTYNLDTSNITFSIDLLLDNEIDKKKFMKLVLSEEYRRNKSYIKDTNVSKLDPKEMFGYQHGAVFSLTENEFILNNVPTSICKIQLL